MAEASRIISELRRRCLRLRPRKAKSATPGSSTASTGAPCPLSGVPGTAWRRRSVVVEEVAVVWIFMIAVCAAADVISRLAGVLLQATKSMGSPEQERLMNPVNPLTGVMVMVVVAVPPTETVAVVGARAMVKSGRAGALAA